MCIAVKTISNQQYKTVYFPHHQAKIVVKLNDTYDSVTWGKRRHEVGNLPAGNCAYHEDIEQGKWDPYFPRPVLVPATHFLARDVEGKTHWHELVKGQCLTGILANFSREVRLYIVVIRPTAIDCWYHCWPLIHI